MGQVLSVAARVVDLVETAAAPNAQVLASVQRAGWELTHHDLLLDEDVSWA